MRRVSIGDVTLAYEDAGGGEPLIQLHGAGFGHHNFTAVTPYLTRHFRVLNLDQRGFGESDRPRQEYTFESWADDVVAFMDALGIDSAHVHGTSMGGPVAVNVAARHPSRVKGLIVSCSLVKPDRYARISYELVRSLARSHGVASQEVARFIALCALSREYLERPDGDEAVQQIADILEVNNDPDVFDRAWQLLIEMDLTPTLADVRAPALILEASEDIVITPARMATGRGGTRELEDGIAQAELAVIEGSSHSHLFEKPQESATAIIGFLRRLQAGGDPTFSSSSVEGARS
jgi:3-oxoadipate enol-lactonase